MSLLTRLLGPDPVQASRRVEPRFMASSPENPATDLANPAEWLTDWASGGAARNWGPAVSERTAMTVSGVYRSVSIISGIGASLPIRFYRDGTDGRAEIHDHPLAPLFWSAPYTGRPISAYTWRELWFINLLLWGNHYSIIRRNGAGAIVGFEPVLPWNVEVFRNGYRNVYRCEILGAVSGIVDQAQSYTIEYVTQENMIHIPGPGFNGLKGLSRIRSFARNAISLASLLEDQTGYVHENAAKPSAFITPGKKMSPDGFKRFKAQFSGNYTGRANAGRVIYADEGATYTAMQMTPEDLNTIEARRYQLADVSRFFGVPLHLLNEMEKATAWGAGLAEQNLALGLYTVNPDLNRVESELNLKLDLGQGVFIEFDRDWMLAMDPLKDAQVAQTEIASGALTINERRKKKNRAPVDHGDRPLINSTNIRLDALYEQGAQPRQDPIAGPAPAAGDQSPAAIEWRRLNTAGGDPVPADPT